MKDRIKAQTNICSFDTFPYQIELANMKNTEWFQVLQECNEKACSAVSRFEHVFTIVQFVQNRQDAQYVHEQNRK